MTKLSGMKPQEHRGTQITPVSAQHSLSFQRYGMTYDAAYAIDKNMSTKSIAMPETKDTEAWLKIKLDRIYCIVRVVRFRSKKQSNNNTHICTENGCGNCHGWKCDAFNLSVFSDVDWVENDTEPDFKAANEPQTELGRDLETPSCENGRPGNTVEFRSADKRYYIAAYEVAIFTV